VNDTSTEGDSEMLPAVLDDDEIVDGEIVDELPAVVVPAGPVVQVVQVMMVVVRHEHAKTATRHVAYLPLGVFVALRWLWESRSTARYDRAMRAAETAGNHKDAIEWDQRRAEFVKARHERKMQRSENRIAVAKALPWIALAFLLVPLAIGALLAIAQHRAAALVEPIEIVARVTEDVATAVAIAWGPLILAAPWLAGGALWWTGRHYAGTKATGWLAAGKTAAGETGLVVTADTIVLALQNLPIPAMKAAFKTGWKPAFHLTPTRDGRGYSAVFAVPLGVTAEMVADQTPVLARNLYRAEVEVWPTDAEKSGKGPAGSVAVWVADSGVLSKAAPEYPLLHEGTADVFAGVPGGVVARGDGLTIPIVGNNSVFGGQMGQGKSNACRVVMLGCALDPLCELNVFVFANNGDFDSFAPRLAVYRKGLEDDAISAAVDRLHELYAEVGRREGRLAELGAKKVTRGLAEAHPDLRPVVVLFSECHELFGHPEFGELAAELATKTAKRARKTAITLIFDTQSSRKEAIPPKLVELVSVNGCFYVKSWRSNDGFLGDGSFAAGIRATELRPGRDRGTSLITGVSDEQFELLRWYYIEVNDDTGFDAATEVIARAMGLVDRATPVDGNTLVRAIETRDLLDDVAEVIGDERVKLRDLVGLLRTLAPRWSAYKDLTAKQLGEDLADAGVRTVNTSGTPYLDPADLRRAVAERSE
jgi:DNA segregation ATPase FtsK/SpoIIIE, S-DNA-T family